VTANVDNPRKRRYGYQPAGAGKPATTDHAAPMMVAGWDQEQRRRIRGILMALALNRPQADLTGTPEMRVVAMIDQAGKPSCG
jgi:hypothetical protein